MLEVIPKAGAETLYFIKYTVDGEEETVSSDNIRRVAAKSMDSTTSVHTTSTTTDDGIMSESYPDALDGVALGDLSLTEKSVEAVYTPKLSIGDDGTFVPELYEGMTLAFLTVLVVNDICSVVLLNMCLIYLA